MKILYVTYYDKEKINISGNAKNIIEQVNIENIDYIESCLLCFKYSLVIFEDYDFYTKSQLLQSFRYINDNQENAIIMFDTNHIENVYMLDLYMKMNKNNNLFKSFDKKINTVENIIKKHIEKIKKQDIKIGDYNLSLKNKGNRIHCKITDEYKSIEWDIEFNNNNEADLFMFLCHDNKFKDKDILMDFLYSYQQVDNKKIQLLIAKIRQSLGNIGVSDFFKLQNKRNEGYNININLNSNIIDMLLNRFGIATGYKQNHTPTLFDFYNI